MVGDGSTSRLCGFQGSQSSSFRGGELPPPPDLWEDAAPSLGGRVTPPSSMEEKVTPPSPLSPFTKQSVLQF
jgi:hypothetical protein